MLSVFGDHKDRAHAFLANSRVVQGSSVASGPSKGVGRACWQTSNWVWSEACRGQKPERQQGGWKRVCRMTLPNKSCHAIPGPGQSVSSGLLALSGQG